MKQLYSKIALNIFKISLLFIITSCNKPIQPNENQKSQRIQITPSEQTYKPWAYWFWMGNSVTKEGITKNLKDYAASGLGGLHIVPFYGEKGDEDNFIDYLSPRWMEMLVHTVNEAEKLGLGIDMTTGTGWPFGGPKLSFDQSAKTFLIKKIDLDTVKNINEITRGIKEPSLICLSAQNSDNSFDDITKSVQSNGVIVNTSSYKKAFALIMRPTRQKVKRAAPGGKGLVLDYFNKTALNFYMDKFQSAFNSTKFVSGKVRAFYNDSYEVYGANFTSNFLEKFKELRAYDLVNYLHIISDTTKSETKERIVSDYCETVSDLLYSEFSIPWVKNSNDMGMLTRNQAHGSPGNLLDLYATADIPETESFGVSDLSIPGLRQDPDFEEDRYGRPNPLTMKFASSAAHIYDKKLVASETATWLGDHFKVALSQIKPHIDESFTAGINHIVYQSITYNPPEKPFPGRLIYASTNFGTRSHFWEELPALNKYIERCQKVLQNSQPHNDVLVYFPIHDVWAKKYTDELIIRFDVHHSKNWLEESSFGEIITKLWKKGFTFDYVSDRMLETAEFSNGKIALQGGNYKTIVVPDCKYMPESTLNLLRNLAKKGAPVIFQQQLPTSVPGYYNLENRIEKFEKLKTKTAPLVTISQDVSESLLESGVDNEELAGFGLSFIRKQNDDAEIYFVSNLSNAFNQGEVALAVAATSVEMMDPLTGASYTIPSKIEGGKTLIHLQLEPGKSCILTCKNTPSNAPVLTNYSTSAKPSAIEAEWTITPKSTETALPKAVRTSNYGSWTEFSDAWSLYSGKAVYACEFELAKDYTGKEMLLDLGDVRETAKVTINGEDLGLLWCIPYKTVIPKNLLQKKNKIEIEVTNLSFNKVIDLDRKGVQWKNFHDINFVNIKYEPYDASDKVPVPSGLLTTITICPIQQTAKTN